MITKSNIFFITVLNYISQIGWPIWVHFEAVGKKKFGSGNYRDVFLATCCHLGTLNIKLGLLFTCCWKLFIKKSGNHALRGVSTAKTKAYNIKGKCKLAIKHLYITRWCNDFRRISLVIRLLILTEKTTVIKLIQFMLDFIFKPLIIIIWLYVSRHFTIPLIVLKHTTAHLKQKQNIMSTLINVYTAP